MSNKISLDELLKQEQANRFDIFDFTAAWEIGNMIHDYALEKNHPVAIEVYAFGQVLFTSALPGSFADNLFWMQRKRNTVLKFSHSSLYIGLNFEYSGQKRMDEQSHIDQFSYTDHGGSFPISLKSGAVIGAVTLSGLASEVDHEIALWGIQQYLKNK